MQEGGEGGEKKEKESGAPPSLREEGGGKEKKKKKEAEVRYPSWPCQRGKALPEERGSLEASPLRRRKKTRGRKAGCKKSKGPRDDVMKKKKGRKKIPFDQRKTPKKGFEKEGEKGKEGRSYLTQKRGGGVRKKKGGYLFPITEEFRK